MNVRDGCICISSNKCMCVRDAASSWACGVRGGRRELSLSLSHFEFLCMCVAFLNFSPKRDPLHVLFVRRVKPICSV